MKTMCPPGYYHNGFVATHALGTKCALLIIELINTWLLCPIVHEKLPEGIKNNKKIEISTRSYLGINK